MAKLESKTGRIDENDEVIFGFLADFNNYGKLIPQERVKNWEASKDHCSFSIDGMGNVGLQIVEREAHKLVKISSEKKTMLAFTMWVQLKKIEEKNSAIRITLDVDISPLMLPVVKKPLQEFIDTLIDRMEEIPFSDLSGQDGSDGS